MPVMCGCGTVCPPVVDVDSLSTLKKGLAGFLGDLLFEFVYFELSVLLFCVFFWPVTDAAG